MRLPTWEIHHGDVLEELRGMAAGSVHMCVTSPPYWGQRDYAWEARAYFRRSVCQSGWQHTPIGER